MTVPFTFTPLGLPEVLLVTPRFFPDDRGVFAETYKHSEFVAAGVDQPFVQDNLSRSRQGVVRGLHYQLPPHAQGKLILCTKGSIFDVAVDIRKTSPTFGQHVHAVLSRNNGQMLWVPPGFAHGFAVISDFAEIYYKCTVEYRPEADKGITWNDPTLKIAWPIADPLVSPKDRALPCLKDAEVG